MKVCSECGEEKPLSDFYTRLTTSGGLYVNHRCKPCHNKVRKRDRERQRLREPSKKGKELNPKRYQTIVENLSPRYRKIFDAVPKATPWSIPQILGELERLGLKKSYIEVEGCIKYLAELKVIEAHPNRTYMRLDTKKNASTVSVKSYHAPPDPVVESTTVVATTPEIVVTKTETKKAETNNTVVEKLGYLATRVEGIISSLKALASDMETAALEIEEIVTKNDEDTKKLKQLQALLRSLND